MTKEERLKQIMEMKEFKRLDMIDTQTVSYIHIWNVEGFYKVFLHDDMSRCNRKFKRLKEAVKYAQNYRRFIIHIHRKDGKVVQEIKPKLKVLTHTETITK